MEVWALQGHGAAYNLLELTTLKSDDPERKLAQIISEGKLPDLGDVHVPMALETLLNELRGLSLDIQFGCSSADPQITEEALRKKTTPL